MSGKTDCYPNPEQLPDRLAYYEALFDLARSAVAALVDLDAGYPWRELHVDVQTLRHTAESLGITFDE